MAGAQAALALAESVLNLRHMLISQLAAAKSVSGGEGRAREGGEGGKIQGNYKLCNRITCKVQAGELSFSVALVTPQELEQYKCHTPCCMHVHISQT